jgi:cytochrome c biogenesis protein CcmG, thiol:disulfide interchange protein DsbE
MRRNDNVTMPVAPGAGAENSPAGLSGVRWWTCFAFLIPVAVFVALAATFAVRLGTDPSLVPSPLIGKAVPEFSLPPVKGRQLGLASTDLKGEVSLVNIFASWCVACRQEHPVLMQLNRTGTVPVHGLNYKNRPDDAARWLNTMGDPYTRTGADLDGRVGIDWGVYGVPETFVVDAEGRVAFKQVGALTPRILDQTILPLVRQLQQKDLHTP